jgi:hypothetical protein
MATITQLEKAGVLAKLDAQLSHKQQEFRCFYASQKLVGWLQNDLYAATSQHNLEQTPAEQVDALFEIYCSGGELIYEWTFKDIRPIGSGVWEFKTADVRIFGWFCSVDVFVGVVADFAWRIKKHNLYAGYRDEVLRFIGLLEIDEPKCLMGGVEDGIVSNFDYPDT